MDFLGKLFGRDKKNEKKIPVKLKPAGIEGWLDKRGRELEEESSRKALPVLEEIRESAERIRDLALDLKEKEIPKDIPERAVKVVKTSKPAFVQGILEAVGGIGADDAEKDIETYCAKLEAAVTSLPKVMIGQGRYLPVAYGRELDEIRNESKKLFEAGKYLEKLPGQSALTGAKKDLEELGKNVMEAASLEKESSGLSERIEQLKRDKAGCEEEYGRIRETGEYGEYLADKKNLDEAERQMEEIRTYTANLLTPLRRPLRILKKSGNSECSPPQSCLTAIEQHIDEPEKMLYSSGDELKAALKTLLSHVEESRADIKANERKKIASRIDAILKADIDKKKDEFDRLKKRSEEISGRLASSRAIPRMEELERKIEVDGRESLLKEDELLGIKKRKARIGEEIKELDARIRENLKKLGAEDIIIDLD
ncbi:MAG: hypothetical protein JW724_07990 [Candidatus Altiarchaeota archaeon]|nr:hypothetical protein [Candidatus Altiarchaeota archaeon]